MKGLTALVVLVLLAPGCQASSSSSAPPPASANVPAAAPGPVPGPMAPPAASAPTAPPGTVTVQQMAGLAPGSKAVVRGMFLGWRGPCRGQAPSRGAWQLADADQPGAPCLYVDGPMPPGANAATPPPAPLWVRVDGMLQVNGPDHFIFTRHVEREP